EDGGGGKSDLGHFKYSSILMFCPRALGGIRVARTTPRWSCPAAVSNHEIVRTEPFGSILKSAKRRVGHNFLS
ncbi:MAG: hypothetical protein ABJB10_05295, partial [Mesorhizobium sp.]